MAGANPFLMMEEEFSSNTPVNSNPFLMDNSDFTNELPVSDNPFLFEAPSVPTTNGTNPFAFAPEPPVSSVPNTTTTTTDSIFNLPNDTNDFFGGSINETELIQPVSVQQPIVNSFFTTNSNETFTNNQLIFTDAPIQKPDVLELKHTNTVKKVEDVSQIYSSDEELTKAPPRRPPPPRPPCVPPSKETQDLIMSVTGAMDATSSHLLDRIPPTRTPSPVSMRDLHSPSPTPDHVFADFLDVEGAKPHLVNTNNDVNLLDVSDSTEVIQPTNPQIIDNKPSVNSSDSFMSLMSDNTECDINQNHSVQSNEPPARPVRPQPPRPLPPQKPPPPIIKPTVEPVPQQIPETTLSTNEFLDMFGEPEKPIEKPVASTADIMSLYSAPPVVAKSEPIDLLCDSNGPGVTETLISPELSQHDLHMDTSDTQSKGSGSSATFNPFTSEETIVPAMLDTSSPIKIQNDILIQENTFMPSQPEINTGFIENDSVFSKGNDDFDAFAAKFDSAVKDNGKNAFDPFSGGTAWGDIENDNVDSTNGFDADEPFDAFLSMQGPPAVPQGTPAMLSKRESQESDEDKDFSVFIKPKNADDTAIFDASMPVLAPPPKSPVQNTSFTDNSPRFNPFDQQTEAVGPIVNQIGALPFDMGEPKLERTDSQETPPTPLFDDDVSQPLEDYPRLNYIGDGWEMQLRQPNKKKITGQRFWKKIFVRLVVQEGCPILQLSNTPTDKDPFQELPLQPCYSVSEIGAQQYDNYGKIFTIKLQYVFYKERPGVRPGQVTKAERITNKLSQFAAYAIQGDYQGVKEFGSDLKKLGLPVEHAPQVSQLLKLGSLNYEDLKQFSVCIEEALFKLSAHRDRALHYKMEEVQITAVDELYVEQSSDGCVEKQIARVRLFFLGFLSGMPDVELGANDMRRQGKEVVGRHDIIPVITEEWIRLEEVEFHACVQQEDYHKTHIIKFKPPDACYIELMRFRIRPPKNRELPLQLKPVMCITGNKVEIKADVLVPGFASRKLGQVPCEDVMIRIPIPECWIYLFRVEKHFRYGSVKSTHRRTGKIKGIERFLGTVETLQESLIEVTSGHAKYEHQHRAIVWRIPRLPKEGQGAYTTHNLVCRLALTSYDQVPDHLAEYCYVEFTMPATQASHTTVRSVSLQNSQSDDPPEKYVRYLARHEYKVGIEHTEGEEPGAYSAATAASRTPAPPAPVPEEAHIPEVEPESSSDSD